MFTGIVKQTSPVVTVDRRENAMSFVLDLGPYAAGLQIGASVAVSGVCLTVTALDEGRASFDVMGETLVKTSLGELQPGSLVNVERSATVGAEIGGHDVSGHVTGKGVVTKIEQPTNNYIVTIGMNPEWMDYVFPKGFIAVDGCSLTIVDVGPDWFTVHLIPETLHRTTFSTKSVGDPVNIEIDSRTQAIVNTMKEYLKKHAL